MDVAKVMNVLPGVDPLDTVTDIITQQNVSTTTDYTAMLTPGVLQVCGRAAVAGRTERAWTTSCWPRTDECMLAASMPYELGRCVQLHVPPPGCRRFHRPAGIY